MRNGPTRTCNECGEELAEQITDEYGTEIGDVHLRARVGGDE